MLKEQGKSADTAKCTMPEVISYFSIPRKKYHQKYEYLQARVTPAEKETVTAHAEAMGESLNAFMRRAFTETMERDKVSKKAVPK